MEMMMMMMMMSKVQSLFDASEAVFCNGRGGIPTLTEIRWLQSLLDGMEPADVGIDGSIDDVSGSESSQEDESSSPITITSDGMILGRALKQITYVHIHQCEDFSMGIFCFPAGACMPLHDHPGMAVLTKVLYGSVTWNAYDWVTSPNSNPRKYGLAKVVAEEKLLQASSKPTVLFPSGGGNIHSFTAVTPCAILDVLAPPYSDELGRPSTYYVDIPIPSLPGFCMLEETDLPKDLVVAGAPYLGPQLTCDDYDDADDEDEMY
ncbi:hypothetical protein Cni_G03037 [Canna indica]|uniref:cysteine dioxygenase n=1 Tax=Canna indica TaxID=4628 RepID=A0AAQ3Q0Q1_9LILI|nr:hypothetical protein Cni_G03037 [Canna indica]